MGLFGKKKEKAEELSFGFPGSERASADELPGILPPPPMPGEKRELPPKPLELPQAPAPIRPVPVKPIIERVPEEVQVSPEEVLPPREPVIREIRPHVFLKIDKYKEVMTSIDRMAAQIRDLTRSLENLKDIEDKELVKLKDTEATLIELNNIANAFDKIFSNPAK